MILTIILIYLAAMLLLGWWGKQKAKNTADFRVAGRRLGPWFYTGTMAAVVVGGASTVGGIGLGYEFGISGMWLVVAIATGVIILSIFFAARIQKLKVYTVSEMMALRYGPRGVRTSSFVMLAYTLMLSVTSTAAYASIFTVLFDINRPLAILIGGSVVITYSALGGMWSITLTDMMQFICMTVGIFFLLLPFSLANAGGFDGLTQRLDATYFSLDGMGLQAIITQFVVYGFGLLIGQDIWQRVFTAGSPKVARWGGISAGVYVALFGIAGAFIGMSAAALLPNLEDRDQAFATMALEFLPPALAGIVMAAGVAAMMSTASGTLIASATVARVDVVPYLRELITRKPVPREEESSIHLGIDRIYVVVLGLFATVIALLVDDVVTALTIAYDLLVGGLLVAILGGLVWKRGTGTAASLSMLAGAIAVITGMGIFGVLANEPIYIGLIASAAVYIVGSLLTKPTNPEVLAEWTRRATPKDTQDDPNPAKSL